MITPYAQSTQNNNKCPHGLPIGTCPICNGMSSGGASKDRNKPRKAGEMSYNECLAQWHKMQRAQQEKQQAKLDKLEGAKLQNELLSKSFDKITNGIAKFDKNFSEFSQKINSLPLLLKIPAKIASAILTPVVNLISKIPNIVKNTQTFFNNVIAQTGQFINSVSEKLSSFLGEIKNFIQEFSVINKTKKTIKTLLSLFSESQEEESEEKEKAKLKDLKRIFKSLFKKKDKNEEKIEKEENNESNFI